MKRLNTLIVLLLGLMEHINFLPTILSGGEIICDRLHSLVKRIFAFSGSSVRQRVENLIRSFASIME